MLCKQCKQRGIYQRIKPSNFIKRISHDLRPVINMSNIVVNQGSLMAREINENMSKISFGISIGIIALPKIRYR